MNTTIYQGIDLVWEAKELLHNLAAEEQPLEIKKSVLNKYEVSPELLEEPFGVWAKLLTAGKKKLKPHMDKVREYFTPYKEEGTLCKAAVTLLFNDSEYGMDLKSRREECLSYTREQRSREFCKLIQAGYGLDADVVSDETEQYRSLEDVLECLDASDYTAEQKWQMQWVFNHPVEAWEEVEPLLEKTVEVIEENEVLWHPLVETFYNNWKVRLEKQTLHEYIKKQVGMAVEENPLGTAIVPLIMGANQFHFITKADETEKNRKHQDICRMGIIVERLEIGFLMVKPVAQKKYTASMLKILSDESKLEILSLLKERRYYGGELAKKLDLTTATISHHMTILVSNGLVTVNKEMNRVYYELNEPVIQKLLDDTRALLLKEQK